MIQRFEKFHSRSLAVPAVIVLILAFTMPAGALTGAPLASMCGRGLAAYQGDESTGSVVDEVQIRNRAALLRAGFSYGPLLNAGDSTMNKYYDERWGIMVDCFFYRLRTPRGNGIDLFARFNYREMNIDKKTASKNADLLYLKNHARIPGVDVGFRAIYGLYFFGELWQLYLVAAPRFIYYRLSLSQNKNGGKDVVRNFYSIGVIGGAGFEVSLIAYLGVFAEYTIGYTPVGKNQRNIDGHQAWVGITWRTLVRH